MLRREVFLLDRSSMTQSIKSRAVPLLAMVFAAGLLASWFVVAVNQRDTDYQLNHVTGAWIGLSHWTLQGKFYPPLEADGYYGGTRFGPLALALQATAHHLAGHPIVGPKLLHMGYLLMSLGALGVLLRRLRLPGHVVALLACSPLTMWVVWEGSMSIRHDLLAVAIQAWAVVLLGRVGPVGVGRVAAVAALCALAPLAKFSGMWATAACGLYLLGTRPGRLLVFLPVWAAVLGGGLALTEWASQGNFSQTMRLCLFASEQAGSLGGYDLKGLVRHYSRELARDPVLLLMTVLALIGGWVARRDQPLLALSGLFIVLMTGYLLTRNGISSNHLVDLAFFGALGTGLLWSRLVLTEGQARTNEDFAIATSSLQVGYTCTVALVLLMTVAMLAPHTRRTGPEGSRLLSQSLKELLGKGTHSTAMDRVLRHLEPGDQVLSCDASVPVLMGNDPVILDPFMLRVYLHANPERKAELILRIERQEFDVILLEQYADPSFEEWESYSNVHWTESVTDAIHENYAFERSLDFAIWRPIPRTGKAAAELTDQAPPPGSAEPDIAGSAD